MLHASTAVVCEVTFRIRGQCTTRYIKVTNISFCMQTDTKYLHIS